MADTYECPLGEECPDLKGNLLALRPISYNKIGVRCAMYRVDLPCNLYDLNKIESTEKQLEILEDPEKLEILIREGLEGLENSTQQSEIEGNL